MKFLELVALAMFCSALCWQPAAQTVGASGVRIATPDDAMPLVAPSLVKVIVASRDGQTMTGTGFSVSSEGVFLTTAHSVSGAEGGVILQPANDSRTYAAAVLQVSRASDFALVRAPALRLPALVLSGRDPRPGERVYVIGFDVVQGGRIRADSGLVYSTERGMFLFQRDIAFVPGFSGSPIIDASGAIVGLLVASRNAVMSGFDQEKLSPGSAIFGLATGVEAFRKNITAFADFTSLQKENVSETSRMSKRYLVVNCDDSFDGLVQVSTSLKTGERIAEAEVVLDDVDKLILESPPRVVDVSGDTATIKLRYRGLGRGAFHCTGEGRAGVVVVFRILSDEPQR